MIRSREIRYLSPSVYINEKRRVVRLDSAGLVHKPALKGGLPVAAARLAASDHLLIEKETDMDATDQTDPKGAEGEGKTPDQLLAKIEQLLKGRGVKLADGASRETVLQAVIELLGGGSNEGIEETPASAGRSADKHAAVLAATLGQSQELAAMKAREADRLGDERVQVYVNSGVLNPNDIPQMEAARYLAMSDPDRFESLISHAVPIIPVGRAEAPSRGPGRRSGIIGEARRAFEGDAMTRKLTSEQAFVDRALADANFTKLSDEELTAYSIAAPVD